MGVYSEYEFINRNLTHPRFEVVEGMADADVLWLTSYFKDFEALSNKCLVAGSTSSPVRT